MGPLQKSFLDFDRKKSKSKSKSLERAKRSKSKSLDRKKSKSQERIAVKSKERLLSRGRGDKLRPNPILKHKFNPKKSEFQSKQVSPKRDKEDYINNINVI